MTVIVGIDPGLDGGFAVLAPDETYVFAAPTTTDKKRQYLEAAMAGMLADAAALGPVRAVIEAQSAMPGQGVTSMFHIGLGYGLWRGMFAAFGISYEIVRPQEWRAAVGLPKGSEKGASVALAQRLFPSLANELVGPRGGVRDGCAEALLIAEAARRHA